MIVRSSTVILIITDQAFQLMTFQSYIKELEMTVTLENIPVHYFLHHVNSLLHIVVLTSTAVMLSKTSCRALQVKKNSSYKKVAHQRRGIPDIKQGVERKTTKIPQVSITYINHTYIVRKLCSNFKTC